MIGDLSIVQNANAIIKVNVFTVCAAITGLEIGYKQAELERKDLFLYPVTDF